MEGYSVEEAATVLGVPKGRVWELLARGVLAGTPEDGGGMRVFLRGESAAASVVPASDTRDQQWRGGGNGNGDPANADPAFEASPFRELLTEFRNLTERYGQALLALGEARGEVAGLRTRVELLEARLDLRLPGPSGWAPPTDSEPEVAPGTATDSESEPSDAPVGHVAEGSVAEGSVAEESVAEESVAEGSSLALGDVRDVSHSPEAELGSGEPDLVSDAADEEEDEQSDAAQPQGTRRQRRRRRKSRSAVTGIAEALARADDPTSASLPEPGEASAALPHELATDSRPTVLSADAATGPAVREADPLTAPESVAPTADVPSEELEPVVVDPEPASSEPASRDDVRAPADAEASMDVLVEAAPEASAAPAPEADTAGYSSEWDEPDWIAEEDIAGGWETGGPDFAAGPTTTDATESLVLNEVAAGDTGAAEPVVDEAVARSATQRPLSRWSTTGTR